MENQIVKHEPQVITEAELVSYLDSMGLAQKLNEKEKVTFLQIAKAFNLNPFKREIYVVKYKENDPLTIITGYEVYIKRAERSGVLDGWGCVTEGKVEDNSLKATLTIHRKDRKFPFVHEVLYSEYVQMKAEYVNGQATGKKTPNAFWQKAHTMIKKVATAQGFRLCFSDELGGMPYTPDELPSTEDAQATEVPKTSTDAPAVNSTVMTPQPEITNHVHSVNSIKKCTTFDELKTSFDRTNFETQSHPLVVDAVTQFMVAMINASANGTTLQSVWTSIGTIGKAKEFKQHKGIVDAKNAKKLELGIK